MNNQLKIGIKKLEQRKSKLKKELEYRIKTEKSYGLKFTTEMTELKAKIEEINLCIDILKEI